MTCEDCAHLREVVEKLNMKMSDLIKLNHEVEKGNTELKAEIQKQLSSRNIREQEDVFKSFTGLHPVKFDILQFLNPGENACNSKYYEASKQVSDEPDKCKFTEGSVGTQCSLLKAATRKT